MTDRKDIRNLTRNMLINWCKKNDFSGFRGKQIFNWLYQNLVTDFSEMQNLPDKLINLLAENFTLNSLTELKRQISSDDTVKFLWKLPEGNSLESVYLPYKEDNRYSACISSQVGCALNCQFCITAEQGLIRNLTSGEIVAQIIKIERFVRQNLSIDKGLTNIVFMGMGEPLANTDSVFRTIDIINDDHGLNIGQRKITISTAGLVPGIKQMGERELQVGLAVSLNAPTDKLRNKLMPINQKYPLSELLPVVKDYIEKTGRRVTFEYILLNTINDQPIHAKQLIELIENINCHVNLIPVNPGGENEYNPPPEENINRFYNILNDSGLNVTKRQRKGTDIDAACGQLKSRE